MDVEFTYRCLRCANRLSRASRPDGCPECGGRLLNDSLGRFRSTA